MIQITTAYSDRYLLDDDGYVLKFSNGLRKDANSNDRKTWQIIGAWYNIGFGHVRTISLSELLTKKELYLKKREPKYGMIDIDHNTKRFHGNKKYHGISSVSKI